MNNQYLTVTAIIALHLSTVPGFAANLIDNGSFEEIAEGKNIPAAWNFSPPAGATAELIEEGRYGQRVLALKFTEGNTNKSYKYFYVSSKKFPLDPGKYYHLRVLVKIKAIGPHSNCHFKIQPFNKDGQGLSCPVTETHLNKNKIGTWQTLEAVFAPPPESAEGVLQMLFYQADVEKEGSGIIVDYCSLKEFSLPENPLNPRSFDYPPKLYGCGGRFIRDEGARHAEVLKCENGVHSSGGKFGGPNIFGVPAGKYKVSYRFKVTDNSVGKRVLRIEVALASPPPDNRIIAVREISPADFEKPNQYQDFTLEYIHYPDSPVQYRVSWYEGAADIWFDGITAVQYEPLDDRQIFEMLKLGEMRDEPTTAVKARTACLFRGLYTRQLKVEDALKKAGMETIDNYYLVGVGSYEVQPALPEQWLRNPPAVIVLCDVPVSVFRFYDRYALKKYVENGGRLVVFGGFFGYGAGDAKGTFMESLFPFQSIGPFGKKCYDSPLILKCGKNGSAIGFENSVFLRDKPGVMWIHKLTSLDEKALRFIDAGDMPFLIGSEHGKGKLLFCLGTPLGLLPANNIPFWEWKEWPDVLAGSMEWLLK